MTHICVSEPDHQWFRQWLNVCSASSHFQANAGMLSPWPLRTYFNDILIEIRIYSYTKIHFKISFAKSRPFAPPSLCKDYNGYINCRTSETNHYFVVFKMSDHICYFFNDIMFALNLTLHSVYRKNITHPFNYAKPIQSRILLIRQMHRTQDRFKVLLIFVT